MKKKWIILVVVLLATIGVLTACSGESEVLSQKDKELVNRYLSPEQVAKAAEIEEQVEEKIREGATISDPVVQVVFPGDLETTTTAQEGVVTEEIDETGIYTSKNYPRNPENPGQVAAIFFFRYNKKEFSEVAEFLTRESFQRIQAKGGLEHFYNQSFGGHELQEVWIGKIEIENEKASIYPITLIYKNGYREVLNDITHLKQEDGRWKIDM